MSSTQAGVHVLIDAEQAEEGEQTGTPAPGVLEVADVEVTCELTEVVECQCGLGRTGGRVAVVVLDANSCLLEQCCTRQLHLEELAMVAVERRDEGRQGGSCGCLSRLP